MNVTLNQGPELDSLWISERVTAIIGHGIELDDVLLGRLNDVLPTGYQWIYFAADEHPSKSRITGPMGAEAFPSTERIANVGAAYLASLLLDDDDEGGTV
jgi:hypothetical protein